MSRQPEWSPPPPPPPPLPPPLPPPPPSEEGGGKGLRRPSVRPKGGREGVKRLEVEVAAAERRTRRRRRRVQRGRDHSVQYCSTKPHIPLQPIFATVLRSRSRIKILGFMIFNLDICKCSLLSVNAPCPSHKLRESGGGATPEIRRN